MYEIDVDASAREQIRALPEKALVAVMEAMTFLELTPWNGSPIHKANPQGAVRQVPVADGLGLLTYLVLEDQRRVDVLDITWLGD
ncbi:hypothetical protein ACFQV2_04070 [Actinokineospora soli]|uniref:mRNA interferase RelE/StbE n=1 Tax=Actinokineospora soli TaxID=1048753 RepID=A0ABW2TJE0_9PSEU